MRVSREGLRREALCLSVGVLLTVLAHGIEAVEFNMLFMTKCISEEISKNTQVELEYRTYDKQDANRAVQTRLSVMPLHILDLPFPLKAVQIEDPRGNSLYDGSADYGNVTFKAQIQGDYKACFNVPSNAVASRVKLRLEWRMGPASFDWDVIAKKEHLDEIDAYMQRFTRTIKSLNDELKEIRITENKMREITEATNTRVTMLSLFCVVVCVAITIGQVWYLRRFFTKKKII